MKRLIAAALFPLAAFSADVTSDMAMRAANSWIASSSRVGSDSSYVTSAVPRVCGGKVLYYTCHRTSGGTVTVSADTGLDPIVAVSARKYDGKLRTALSDMLDADSSESLKRLAEVRKSRSGTMGGTVPNGSNDDVAANESTWKSLLDSTPKRRLSAAPAAPEIVLPGFEDGGGVLTHWAQDVARKDTEGTLPAYNYYMHGPGDGGAPDGGLGLVTGDPEDYPCGCVATALSACAQYFRVLGMKDRTYKCGLVVTNEQDYAFWHTVTNSADGHMYMAPFAAPLPGRYDWSVLPSNYGGSAPAVSGDEELSDEARELLGRVTFNYGVASSMSYTVSGSGSNGFGFCPYIDMFYFGSSFVESTLDAANCNYRPNALGSQFQSKATVNMYSDGYRFIRAAISMGEPVLMSIYSGSLRVGHAVVVVGIAGPMVGTGSGTMYAKVFMGFGGYEDTWFNARTSTVDSRFNAVNSFDLFGYPNRPVQILVGKNPTVRLGTASQYDDVVLTNMSFSVSGSMFGQVECSFSTNFVRRFPDGEWAVGIPYSGWFPSSCRIGTYRVGGGYLSSSPFLSYVSTVSFSNVVSRGIEYSFGNLSTSKNDVRCEPEYGYIMPVFTDTSGRSTKYDMTRTYSGIISVDNPYYTETGYDDTLMIRSTPVVRTSELHNNGYEYGSPFDISVAAKEAFHTGRPLVIVSGQDGTETELDSFLKAKGDSVVRFFIDDDTDERSFGKGSFCIVDSYNYVNDGIGAQDPDLVPNTVYSNFTNRDDFSMAYDVGMKRYSELDPYRKNSYGVDPEFIPGVGDNSNVLYVTSSSYDIKNAVGRGYTSVVFRHAVTYVSRSDVQDDSSIGYVDFSLCPECTIAPFAFYYFRNLKALSDMPSTMTGIPVSIFEGCTSLTRIPRFPNTVVQIGSYAFNGCTSLVSIVGLDNVSSVGSYAFSNTKSLKTAFGWPVSATNVSDNCFNGSGLDGLSGFPTEVTSYGTQAFRGTPMTDAVFGDSVKEIGDYCFYGCTSLTNVVVSGGFRSSGSRPFSACSSLSCVDMTKVSDLSGISAPSGSLFDGIGHPIVVRVSKTVSEMSSVPYQSWGLASGSEIACTDGTVEIQ